MDPFAPRIAAPVDADEATSLVAFLDYQRASFARKIDGLDAEQLSARPTVSTMTLGGLTKHLALVEDDWLSVVLAGVDPATLWADVDWDADFDYEWRTAADDSPEELALMWRTAIARGDAHLSEALASGSGLDTLAAAPRPGREGMTLRWILLHLIEEYARHLGHADLFRETIDGATGV